MPPTIRVHGPTRAVVRLARPVGPPRGTPPRPILATLCGRWLARGWLRTKDRAPLCAVCAHRAHATRH